VRQFQADGGTGVAVKKENAGLLGSPATANSVAYTSTPNIALGATDLALAIRDRARKTTSGEVVVFDAYHVALVIAEHIHPLLDIVQDAQWMVSDECGDHYCDWCQEYQHVGHKDDCELVALLRRYGLKITGGDGPITS
jgi:hypothetical protein